MLNINLKTVSMNSEIITQLIESGEAERIIGEKIRLTRKRNQIFYSVFPSYKPNEAEHFFHWLPLPGRLTSEELELAALQKGIHILGSHRFAMQSEEKSSYVRVSVTSPDTEGDLRKGLLILNEIFEQNRYDFFV